MACRKKYKPYILKYKALISKYMPYIFRKINKRIYSNLQNPSEKPFPHPFSPSRESRMPSSNGDEGCE